MLSAVGGTRRDDGPARTARARDYEARVGAGIQQMLDTVLGQGNAVVSVTADLNFDQAARTTETFSASDPALPADQLGDDASRTYTGTGQAVGGVLGVDGTTDLGRRRHRRRRPTARSPPR